MLKKQIQSVINLFQCEYNREDTIESGPGADPFTKLAVTSEATNRGHP